MLTAGYWIPEYWAKDYWIDDYWPDASAAVARPSFMQRHWWLFLENMIRQDEPTWQ